MGDFSRFDRLQQKANEKYYKRRGRRIYSDFKTFGSSDKIAHANALDFFGWLGQNDEGSEIKVYDFGIGNGLFSRFFLDKLFALDRKREHVRRLSYFLCDISDELLRKAVKEMKGYPVEGILCDATAEMRFLRDASHIRSNEMYDDLPARIFVKTEDGIQEVLMDEKMEKRYARTRIDRETRRFMEKMPTGYEIPVNFAARAHLERCVRGLKNEAYVDIFDYGFSSVAEMERLPCEIWNNAIIREFNRQLTIDVDFIHLADGMNAVTSPQKEYAEKTLREKLNYVEMEQLYYLTDAEARKNAKKMRRFGYPADFLDSGIRETDDYKHLRVRR